MTPLSLPASQRQAFTLVEMLVVIAILALLAAILFPVFGRAREAGRRATCASNLKQISLALQQYTQDYKFYPKLMVGGSSRGGTIGSAADPQCNLWLDKMRSYVKQDSLFVCPSDTDQQYRPGCPASDVSNPDHPIRFSGSYSLNVPTAQMTVDLEKETYSFIYDSARVPSALRYTRPSSTILVCDGINFSWGGFISPGSTQPPPTNAASLPNYGVPDRHRGGVNVAFADGHVKWMSHNALLKLSLWRINGPE